MESSFARPEGERKVDSRLRGNDGYVNRSAQVSSTAIGEPSFAAAELGSPIAVLDACAERFK